MKCSSIAARCECVHVNRICLLLHCIDFVYLLQSTPHYEAPLSKRNKTPIEDGTNSYEIGPIGFKEKASRRLVDVPFCHIATPAINVALEQIRNEKRLEASEGRLKNPKKGATLLLRDADGVVETNHTQYVNTVMNGLTFRFQAGNFFQVSIWN
jgi:tRNA/tmRNA/rRNA uracil-C5-methylase (TrmA/RlmC/RlmD family)